MASTLLKQHAVKRTSRLFFGLFAGIIFASAGSSTSSAATCCVWRLTNSKTPFYLVGTLHALTSSDYPLPKPYREALQNSQRFLFEFDFRQSKEFSAKLRAAAKYPKGQDLRRHVHAQTYQYLARAFQLSGIKSNAYLEYKPWYLAGLWGIRGYNDLQSKYGVDNHFYREAGRAKKEVGGLASVDEHVAVMSGMSDLEGELILLDSIHRFTKNQKGSDFARLHRAWRRGDMATLWALDQHSQQVNPGGNIRLLAARNVKWVPRIRAEISKGKPTAIVCGVNHMLGPNGILALLHRNHYEFEQL